MKKLTAIEKRVLRKQFFGKAEPFLRIPLDGDDYERMSKSVSGSIALMNHHLRQLGKELIRPFKRRRRTK